MATRLNMLPEDCVSSILSLTSPQDSCRFMMASSSLRSASESDIVWDKFLPFDYPHILSTSISPLKFSSKKELFFQLCNSILIDGGIKSFSLNKSCGRKSYILSARALSISLSNETNHWAWISHSPSRFSEVIELKTISNIEIEGRINTKKLSPKTTYVACLIIKVCNVAFGLDTIPCEVSVSAGEYLVTNTAYLCNHDEKKQQLESLFFNNRRRMMEKRVIVGEGRRPRVRKDGWMEVELGEFFVGEKYEEVKMNLMEVKGLQLKGGLIIEGIEVRPIC